MLQSTRLPTAAQRMSAIRPAECADRVAEVAPEAVDAERAPARGCEASETAAIRPIAHRRSDSQKEASDKPPLELMRRSGQKQPGSLNPHPGGDQALATPPIAQRPGHDLENAPGRRIDRLEDADALDAEAERRRKQGKMP